MCFIKKAIGYSSCLPNFKHKQNSPLEQEDKTQQITHCLGFPYIVYVEPTQQICTWSFPLLSQLLSNLQANSTNLTKLQEKLNKTSSVLDEAFEEINKNSEQIIPEEHLLVERWRSKDKVIEKLFGAKEYKYRLKLKHKFPSTIYKERNLALNVQLVNAQGQRVMNSNLVNICIAACEVDGKWIPQNQKGEYFMQGKAEVYLYHGEANFMKIYPRDVSRNFRNGKMSIIVYPKPSLIKFTSSATAVQETIDANLIEPLIAKDVAIRAKKKQNQ